MVSVIETPFRTALMAGLGGLHRATAGQETAACRAVGVAADVLALVPLTPLHQGAVAERFPAGRSKSLPTIQDQQESLGDVEAPFDQGPEERCQHLLVLGVRLDKAQEAFLPRRRSRPPQPRLRYRVNC